MGIYQEKSEGLLAPQESISVASLLYCATVQLGRCSVINIKSFRLLDRHCPYLLKPTVREGECKRSIIPRLALSGYFVESRCRCAYANAGVRLLVVPVEVGIFVKGSRLQGFVKV